MSGINCLLIGKSSMFAFFTQFNIRAYAAFIVIPIHDNDVALSKLVALTHSSKHTLFVQVV